jgi:hypothetical protein
MASEPFEATDDNGNTVTGTVEVFRHPVGRIPAVSRDILGASLGGRRSRI